MKYIIQIRVYTYMYICIFIHTYVYIMFFYFDTALSTAVQYRMAESSIVLYGIA